MRAIKSKAEPHKVLERIIDYFVEFEGLNVESLDVYGYSGYGFSDERGLLYFRLYGTENRYILNVFNSKIDISQLIEPIHSFYQARIAYANLGEGDLPLIKFYKYLQSIRLEEINNLFDQL